VFIDIFEHEGNYWKCSSLPAGLMHHCNTVSDG